MDADRISRAVTEAERAIQLAAVGRQKARATRLRIRLKELQQRWSQVDPAERSIPVLMEEILEAVIAASDANMGNCQIWDGETLRICAHQGFRTPFLTHFAEVRPGAGGCGAAAKRRVPVVVDDVSDCGLFSSESTEVMVRAGALGFHSLPIMGPTGLLGVLSIHFSTRGVASTHREPLAACASQICELVGQYVSGADSEFGNS